MRRPDRRRRWGQRPLSLNDSQPPASARPRLWARIAPAQKSMTRNIAWNGVNSLVPQLVGIATVPILLSHLGIKGYGVWALAYTVMTFVVSMDGGISSSAQRFYSLYLARDEAGLVPRFTTTLLAFVTLTTALLYTLGPVIARTVLLFANVPAQLQPDARFILTNIGLLIGLLLCSNILVGYLRAGNRFRAITISTMAAQIGYVIALVGLAEHLTVALMFTITLVQLGLLNALLVINCASHLVQIRFKFLSWTEIKHLYSYAWRAQITNASELVILQTDALFVAAFLPIEQLGYLAIASQVASGIRSLPMFALAPLLSRVTDVFGHRGVASATRFASKQNRRWVSLISTYSAITLATIGFGVRSWAGDYPAAEAAAVVLSLGNALNLMTGVATVYCRSIGRPGIEARYSLVLVIGNLALSGPFTYFGGLAGAVWSTAGVQLIGIIYFNRVLRRTVPTFDQGFQQLRPFRLTLIAGCALSLSLISLHFPARSLTALAVVAMATAVPALVFVMIERRRNLKRVRAQ
jgi:O-antigen/teichoic acid export membrane protein